MKVDDRIALEVSTTDGALFCFLDSWNGRTLAEFINDVIFPRPPLPLMVKQLRIVAKEVGHETERP